MFLVVDTVSKIDAGKRQIGQCLSAYLQVMGAGSVCLEVSSVDEFADGITAAHFNGKLEALILVCHADPIGFLLVSGKNPLSWKGFGSLLGEYLPEIKVLLLCGCNTGFEPTLDVILSAAPTLNAVYGTREKIGFPDATYGFVSILYHAVVRKKPLREALDCAAASTGVGFAVKIR